MTATWGDLFERAADYDATEADVRRALAERREEAGSGDATDGADETPTDGPDDR